VSLYPRCFTFTNPQRSMELYLTCLRLQTNEVEQLITLQDFATICEKLGLEKCAIRSWKKIAESCRLPDEVDFKVNSLKYLANVKLWQLYKSRGYDKPAAKSVKDAQSLAEPDSEQEQFASKLHNLGK